MPRNYGYRSRHDRRPGVSPVMFRFSPDTEKEYEETPWERDDEGEARMQAMRQRDRKDWDQADHEFCHEFMDRKEEREDKKRVPCRRELEGIFDHLHPAPLPPPLPKSSIYYSLQQPTQYGGAEVHPFLVACKEGLLDGVKRWVQEKKGVLRQLGLQDGLYCAAEGNQIDVARYLLDEGGAFLHGDVVRAACENNSLPFFELFVRHGYHPNQQIPSNSGSFGVALTHCLDSEHEDIAFFLLEHGADPDLGPLCDGRVKRWGERSTPPMDRRSGLALDKAVEKGTFTVIQQLLKHGANPTYARPLHLVIERRRPQGATESDPKYEWRPLMEMLVSYGADVNAAKSGWGMALTPALHKKMWDVVEFLLEHGAVCGVKDFAKAAESAGIAWEETEEVKTYLAHPCDPKSKIGDAPSVPDELLENPLVSILEKTRRKKEEEAVAK